MQARKIEGDLDTKIAAFGKLCSAFEYGYAAGESGLSTDQALVQKSAEIESLINELTVVNDKISTCIGSNGSNSRAHVLARHRDILHDFTQEYKRLSNIAGAARDRADLLGSSMKGGSASNAGTNSTTGLLLRERSTLDRSSSAIDTVVAQAYGVASHLGQQRQLFDALDSKLTSLGAKFPVVNSILNAVRRRKNRENVILASVMAVCVLLILIYWSRK